MKTGNTLLLLCCFVSYNTFAQVTCDQAQIDLKERSWKKDPDALTSKAGAANLPKEQAVNQKIYSVVQALYPKPKGGEIVWAGYFDSPKTDKQYPNAWAADFFFKPYKCINNKEVLISYRSSLFIYCNSLGFMGGKMTLNGKEYSTTRALSEIRDGNIYFIWDKDNPDNAEEEWLITYPGKLPYTYVSRKEYLVEAKAEQTKEMEKMVKSVESGHKIRPQAEQDAEKQKEIDYYKKNYSGPRLETMMVQYEKSYKSDQQKLDDAVALTRKNYQELFTAIDNYLNNSTEEYLSQPAVVLPYGTYSFRSFEKNTTDKNLVYIIRDNPEYYNKNLPVTEPQYIAVLLRHMKKYVPDQLFYEAVNQKALFDNLALMLRK
jgi:hypothetical protein